MGTIKGEIRQILLSQLESSFENADIITISKKHEGQIIQAAPNGDLSTLSPMGILTDVAPTILTQIDMPLAPEMTGTSLL